MGYVKPHIFIFSVYRTSETKEDNLKNHNSVMKYLSEWGHDPVELIGRYKGVDEKSILITGQKNFDVVKGMCSVYNQETFLESNSDRQTDIIDVNTGERKRIGILESVTEKEALASRDFSYNPTTELYYMVKL